MQSSYNVIKRTYIDPNDVYMVKPPAEPVVEYLEPDELDVVKGNDAENVEALAKNVVDNAIKKSEELMENARKEAKSVKEEAYNSGLKKGYADGLKKGNEDGLKMVEETRRNAAGVLEEAHRISREYVNNRREEIINLAFHIANKIIGYEVNEKDEAIMNITKEAIDSAVMKGQLKIYVNPGDFEFLDAKKDELMNAAGDGAVINIIRDADIQKGGCRVETESSYVDATLDAQLAKVKEAILG